jgi:hypothetical protein
MSNAINGLKEFFKKENEFDVLMRQCIYFLLFMDFLLLVFPFVNTDKSYTGITIDTPSIEVFKQIVIVLKDLHLYILGSYTCKKIGKYAVQGVVALACARAGTDPTKSLEAINQEHSVSNGIEERTQKEYFDPNSISKNAKVQL